MLRTIPLLRPPNRSLTRALPPPSPRSPAQIFSEFLLSAPPPDRRSEARRIFLFITSPLIRPVIAAQILCNFVFSNLVASLFGLSYHATAAAAAAAAAASTGSIGAAFTLATGMYFNPQQHRTRATCCLDTPCPASNPPLPHNRLSVMFPTSPPPPSPPLPAVSIPVSLIAYGCVLNSSRSLSSKTAGWFYSLHFVAEHALARSMLACLCEFIPTQSLFSLWFTALCCAAQCACVLQLLLLLLFALIGGQNDRVERHAQVLVWSWGGGGGGGVWGP
jgi:hypothetical protein